MKKDEFEKGMCPRSWFVEKWHFWMPSTQCMRGHTDVDTAMMVMIRRANFHISRINNYAFSVTDTLLGFCSFIETDVNYYILKYSNEKRAVFYLKNLEEHATEQYVNSVHIFARSVMQNNWLFVVIFLVATIKVELLIR